MGKRRVNRARKSAFQEDTLTSQIVKVLGDAILTREFEPGERIKHTELATNLKMSRIPVREAIQKLEEQGWVVTIPRRGTFVVCLQEEEIQKINSLRIVLESEALVLCRERLVPERESTLASLVYQWEARIDSMNGSQAAHLDLSIHRTIWETSGNEYLVKFLTSLTVPLFAHRVISLAKNHLGLHQRSHMPLLKFVQGISDVSAEETIVQHLRTGGWKVPKRYSHIGIEQEMTAAPVISGRTDPK